MILTYTMSCVMTVDIAHPPLTPDAAERELESSLRSARLSPDIRVLRIIHGYGSSGRGGSLKSVAQNWLYRKRSALRAVMTGEEITPFNPRAQELAVECRLSISADLGPATEGMSIAWVK
jgi:hypothetical protein